MKQESRSKNKKFKRVLFSLISFLLLHCFIGTPASPAGGLFHSPLAFAQSLSLSVSPPILEVFIKPGKSVTQVYKITNNGEPTIITPKIVQLTLDGIKDDSFTAENWISLLNTDVALNHPFLLASKETKQLILRVNPPADTREQDYYRALVFSTTPNPAGNSTQSLITENLATPLLITVTASGLIPKGAQLRRFDLPKYIDSFSPLVLDIEVQNTGKMYFRPNGKITLTGIVGKGSYKINPMAILAGEKKKIFAIDALLGQGNPQHTLTLAGFFIGKYEVELDFTLDESTTRITYKKTFYALPFKACLVLSAVIMIIYLLGRKKKKL